MEQPAIRVAVVVGVGENDAPFKSLPGCLMDGQAIHTVLSAADRFDDILHLSTSTRLDSRYFKSQLSDFIKRNSSKRIDEAVFYYSGHGIFASEKFFFVPSDFDEAKPNETGLSNEELDEMFRGLAPTLFVKIVDACHSATKYVKSTDDLQAYLEKTRPRFEDVYFMFSSQSDEKSFASRGLSAFTRALIERVQSETGGLVRYRDLSAAAADAFLANTRQTPRFVSEAKGTEVFCTGSPELSQALAKYLPDVEATKLEDIAPPLVKARSRIEVIREEDAKYIDQSEAEHGLARVLAAVKGWMLPAELEEFYRVAVTNSNEEPGGAKSIGEWLKRNEGLGFFAVPDYQTETYKKEVPADPFARQLSFSTLFSRYNGPTRLVDATRSVIAGYLNTASLSYSSIRIRLIPSFRPLPTIECDIAPLVSQANLRLFYTLRQLRRSDWEVLVPVGPSSTWSWKDVDVKRQDSAEVVCRLILSEFASLASDLLDQRWPQERDAAESNEA